MTIMNTKHSQFERLIRPYRDDLRRSAFYLTRDKADAEDLVQETLLRAYEHIDQITNLQTIQGWLRKILRNLSYNRYRSKVRFLCRSIDSDPFIELPPAPSTTESEFLERLERERLMAALGQLPAEFQEPLRRFGSEGQSYQEIARHLNLPIGTVRSRISRGRKQLRQPLTNV